MKKQSLRTFLWLSAPAVLLLGFGFVLSLPDRPTLRLQSVQIRPVVTRAEVIGDPKGVVAVDVSIEYNNPSMISRFTKEHELWVDPQHGAFIEDEQGNKYGFSSTAPDRLTWRRAGIRLEGRGDENPFNLRFLLRLGQIPESAGKLTLKTIFNLDEEDASKAPAHLPISIVVRQ